MIPCADAPFYLHALQRSILKHFAIYFSPSPNRLITMIRRVQVAVNMRSQNSRRLKFFI